MNSKVRIWSTAFLTATLSACAGDSSTGSMGPALAVSPGLPPGVPEFCGVNYPLSDVSCPNSGVSVSVTPGPYLDSLEHDAGFARQFSSVPVRRYLYYALNDDPIPPSEPLIFTLSTPVRGLVVNAYAWVGNETARITVQLTEANGQQATYELSRYCDYVTYCAFSAKYQSDVGFTQVRISGPAGEHFAGSLMYGGPLAPPPSLIDLSLRGPRGMAMPSEYDNGNPDCSITDTPRDRSYTIRATRASGSEAVAGLPIHLRLGVVEETGSHLNHGGHRPQGSFSRDAELTETVVTTDVRGEARFRYYTPEFGGTSFIVVSASDAREASDTFMVGVPLTVVGPGRWEYYGRGREYHGDVWYGTPRLAQAAIDLADSVYTHYGHTLGFNDMSLRLGGRFDTDGTWTDQAHCSHRWGNTLDLRYTDLDERRRNFIRLQWRRITGNGTLLDHRNHYHLQIPREFP